VLSATFGVSCEQAVITARLLILPALREKEESGDNKALYARKNALASRWDPPTTFPLFETRFLLLFLRPFSLSRLNIIIFARLSNPFPDYVFSFRQAGTFKSARDIGALSRLFYLRILNTSLRAT